MATLYQSVNKNYDFKGTALTFKGKKISYSNLMDNIDIFASKLYNYGIRKDMVVTLVSPNIPETIYTFYALNKIGAIVLVVHPLIPAKTLKMAMERTDSKIVILPDIRASFYQEELKAQDMLLLTPKYDLKFPIGALYPIVYHKVLKNNKKNKYIDRLPLSPSSFPLNTDDQKASVYLRSGGTTGDSKTIVLNDYAINRIANQCNDILGYNPKQTENKKMLAVLPIFHGFGLAMGVHAPLAIRATSALMVSFNPRLVSKMVRKNELNFIILIPYMARKLLALKNFKGKGLQNLSHAFIGGDKVDLKIFEEFDNRMKRSGSSCILMEGYGLTEVVTVNTVNTLKKRRVGSVGLPLDGVKIRITDQEGKVLGPNENGNIELNSDMLMLGYLNDKKTTDEVVKIDENGLKWLRTGDIGMLDNDGYLFFKQRQKEVFKIAGMNVFPNDIEGRALKFNTVKEAAAIFVEKPSHSYVTLFLESPTEDKEKLILEVRKLLEDELIKYSVPEKIIVLESFPRTNVGKVDRNKLADFAD